MVFLDVSNVDNNLPLLVSQLYTCPFALDVHNAGAKLPGGSEVGWDAMERIGVVLVGLESVRIISPCLGEKMARVPFEKPTTRTCSVVTASFPDMLFRFFRFRLAPSSSSVPSTSILSIVALESWIQCTAETRAFWKTVSATAFPDSVSNMRRRCLSIASATCAKSKPEGENALKDAAAEASAISGSESAVVPIGRLLVLARCAFFDCPPLLAIVVDGSVGSR